MIELKDIEVVFNPGTPIETRALQGPSVNIERSEFVTVIGTNGAGKSTLLNVLSGEVTPRSGTVSIDGRDVTRLPTFARAFAISRVFQDPLAGTCANLTILENLAIAYRRGQRRGLGPGIVGNLRNMARDRLARVGLGLERRLDDKIGLLSGGQRQVVSLIMATLVPVQLLLLDEHTAALDPRTAEVVLKLTQDIVAEQRLTTLMVTHSMRQALDYGSRTIMMHEGRVAIDVHGPARAGLTVADLLKMFETVRHEAVTDDALLLSAAA
jgi:putative ABC transport system ATP-binding protein